MKLHVAERLTLLSLDSFPKQGNLVTMRVFTKLMEKIGFSEDELVKWGIKQEGSRVTWETTAEMTAELLFTPKELEMIQMALKEGTNLTPIAVKLAEKFEVKDE